MGQSSSNESGQSIVLLALALVVILAFVALAVDVGFAFVRTVQFSSAVDAAALAGTIELNPTGGSTHEADIRAIQFLGANGWPTPTLKSMSSARSETKLGLPNYTLTATWPVDFFFARVIGLDDYAVTRTATAIYFAQSEMVAPTAGDFGHVRTASQFVYGPDGCSQQGDPVSNRLLTPNDPNSYYPMFDTVYSYQIVVDDDYAASDILRIELLDPDSYNSRPDSTIVHHSLSDGRPSAELSCQADSAGAGDRCIIETGESLAAVNQNPFWLQRIDENWSSECAPLVEDGFGDVVTSYELYYQDESGQRQTLAAYTVDNARDYLHSDMRWVSPGTAGSAVPADEGSFEVILSNVPADELGQRTVELEVKTNSGSGKNAWDLWAGPPPSYFASQGVPSLDADANLRNLQLANNPVDYAVPGLSVHAIGRMPLSHYVHSQPIKLKLAPIDSTLGGGVLYATTYDFDPPGGPADIRFTIDTLSPIDFETHTTLVGNPTPGHSGSNADPLQATCKGGAGCDGSWMLPQYAMPIPQVFFAGGKLEANYNPGGDDHVWSIGVTAGRPFLTN